PSTRGLYRSAMGRPSGPQKQRRAADLRAARRLTCLSVHREAIEQPAPPEALSWSGLQPREPCEEFHDFMCHVSFSPVMSEWPTMAEPSPLFVQLPQVVSPPAVENMPCGSEPVSMSCVLTGSPRPGTTSPFSVSAVALLILFLPECRSATFLAMTTPLAFFQGPLPMRSRALTPASPPGSVVLR